MKIKVKEIPRAGLKFSRDLTAEELGLKDDDVKCLGPLKITGEVVRAQDSLIADVTVEGRYEFICSRCLEKISTERRDDYKVYVDVGPNTEIVDLGEELRQEMLVTLSPFVVCREGCRGLCASCGANLNHEPCRCQKKS